MVPLFHTDDVPKDLVRAPFALYQCCTIFVPIKFLPVTSGEIFECTLDCQYAIVMTRLKHQIKSFLHFFRQLPPAKHVYEVFNPYKLKIKPVAVMASALSFQAIAHSYLGAYRKMQRYRFPDTQTNQIPKQ